MIFFKINKKGKLRMTFNKFDERQTWVDKERATIHQLHLTQKKIDEQELLDKATDLLMSNEPVYIESITEGFWSDDTLGSLCEKDQEKRMQLCNALNDCDYETIGRLFHSAIYQYAKDAVQRSEEY
mgnify:FL=1|tara:strand:+ start:2163 stop:2540 length:378 start_codon:yes stop_codon:yes gene_type:complete